MKILTNLAIRSLISRKVSVILTIVSLTLSISLFQIGNPTNNISWDSYKEISKNPDIEWMVPISLGDSHKQFRVMGTSQAYFERYEYRNEKKLAFQNGSVFTDLYDVVIGSDVAKKLNYNLNDNIVIAHGISSKSLHDEFPFKVKGILKKTGTSVDRLVLVSLEALEVIHKDWKAGIKIPNAKKSNNNNYNHLEPKEITAAIIKIKSPIKIFEIQRQINKYEFEPLQAIIPGISLSKLWQIVSVTENIMLLISVMVIISSFIGMTAILYSTLNGRKKEMALLRIVGASPYTIFTLMITEALIIAISSIFISICLIQVLALIFFPILDQNFGLYLESKFLSVKDLLFLLSVLFLSVIVSIFPSLKASKDSINEGI